MAVIRKNFSQRGTRARPPGIENWNFLMLTLDGILFFGAFAFMDPNTVMPAFIGTLTTSSVLVGLVVTIRSGGWLVPQLIAAHFIEQQPLKKPLLLRFGLISRVAILTLAMVIYWSATLPPVTTLTLFFTLFLVFNVCEGISTVAWIDIVAKTVPAGRRGALFSHMQFFGSLLGLGAGVIVRLVLGSRLQFPVNYGFLLILAAITYSLEYLALYQLREEPGEVVREKRSLLEYFRSMPGLFRKNPYFTRLALIRILLGFNSLVLPFYVVYGPRLLNLAAGIVGIFLVLITAGTVVGSRFYGWLSDRWGNRLVIMATAIAGLLAPCTALLTLGLRQAGFQSGLVYLYAGVFVLVGFSLSGMMMGFTNYLLEIVSESERPSYYGLLNALTAPTALLPLLGGVIIGVFSFAAALLVAVLGIGAGLFLSLGLVEPRSVPRDTNSAAAKSCN